MGTALAPIGGACGGPGPVTGSRSAAAIVRQREPLRAEQMDQRVGNCERRLDRIEQILPTLATRDDLRVAIAPLATKEELLAAVAPLATKEELRDAVGECEQRLRVHFDVVAESLRHQIQLLAEAVAALSERER